MVIELCGNALSPTGFIHAEIVNVEGFCIAQDRIVLHFLDDAEAVAQQSAIVDGTENGPGFVLQQLRQIGFTVFLGTAAEQVRTDLMVDFPHLLQQANHAGNFIHSCKTDFHRDSSFFGKMVVLCTGAAAPKAPLCKGSLWLGANPTR